MNKYLYENLNPKLILSSSTYLKKDWIIENKPYPNRKVEFFELDYIIEGNGFIITEGINIKTKKGRLFIRYPGMKVQGIPPYQSIFFKIDLFNGANMELYNHLKTLPMFIDVYSYNRYLEDFLTLYQTHENDESNILNEKILLLKLIDNIIKDVKMLKIKKSQIKNYMKVEKIKELIKTNPTYEFNLNTLSSIVSLSPNFLCKKFKEYQNETIFEYVNKVKIEYSKTLLATTDEPIYKIAKKLSYNSDTYYYTVFKKYTGETPNSYRNRSWNKSNYAF